MTPHEYLERDRRDEWKNEFVAGEMRPMVHPNGDHVLIATQLGAELHGQLKRTAFRATMMRMRLYIPDVNVYTFPDVMVLRERGRTIGNEDDVSALDPIAIAEVVSAKTERADRGERFAWYREIGSLSDYLLVFQTAPRVEHYTRQDDHAWKQLVTEGLGASVTISSIGCTLRLADIYDRIQFASESAATSQPDPRPMPPAPRNEFLG
jgi:Uma2 family endonuclease